MDVTFRKCGECGNPFLVVYDTDWLCDVCAGKLAPHPHHLSRKELEGRDWENRVIKKQWKKSSDEAARKLIEKCKGSNYYN